MKQRILLARVVMVAMPDGNSVKRTEVTPAVIEWPEGFKPRQNDGYYESGDWWIISMEGSEEAELSGLEYCRTCGSIERPIVHTRTHGYVCPPCLEKARQKEGFEA